MFENFSRSFKMFGLLVQKHSPEILLWGGTAAVVGGTVLACKATKNVDKILEEGHNEREQIHKEEEIAQNNNSEESKALTVKKLAVSYAGTAGKLIKNYGPAATLEVGGLVMMHKSNGILKDRGIALAGALAAKDAFIERYRQAVRDAEGEIKDLEYTYGLKAKEVEVDAVGVDKNGNAVSVKEKKTVLEGDPLTSPYSIFFDERSDLWQKDPHYNMMQLKQIHIALDRKFKKNGVLFWNDVVDAYHFDSDTAQMMKSNNGFMMGWLYYPNGNNPYGDNFIDCGLFTKDYRDNLRFHNECESVVLLDYKPYYIWDKEPFNFNSRKQYKEVEVAV